MALAPGTRLGPYEILAPVGAGGMGEVYRARDPRLGRDVAIKVLPASFSKDPDRLKRFEQEARAAGVLNHPNITAVYDIGSQNGAPYVVQELLEGETLRSTLAGGRLPSRKLVDYGLQIAHGLAAAHDKGIVHRDLKPENVFVTKDGRVKILDFGLAKLTQKDATADVSSLPTETLGTQPGVVLGTLGYMAPEQVRGLPADARSDLFSLGAILYEMLSGRRAFRGDSAADTMSAILKEDPPDLSVANPAISPGLDRIVTHCLEKDRGNRFQTAKDIAFALSEASSPSPVMTSGKHVASPEGIGRKALTITAAVIVVLVVAGLLLWKRPKMSLPSSSASVKRVAVLPFENLGSPEDAYFAAGMTEEIISRLANVKGLAVTSRTSAIEYDRKGKTIKQIGADLGVDFVLEGTVRWEHTAGHEGRVRVTPQLIRVADDTHLWADRYDRVMADVFAIQSELGENVVKAMGVELLPHERIVLKAASTSNMEAHDLYLRGLEIAGRSLNRQDQEGGLQFFQQAVDRDPHFTLALASLAQTHLYMYWLYYDRSPERLDKAKDALDRLDAIGPDLAETHAAHAWYLYWGLLDYPRALEEFHKVLALQPSNGNARHGVAAILRRQGRWEESAVQFAKELENDPRDAYLQWEYGVTCELGRRYAEADRSFGLSTTLYPESGLSWGTRAWLQVLWRGDVDKARAILSEASMVAGLQDDHGWVVLTSFLASLIRRDFQGALRQLNGEKREALSSRWYFLPIEVLRGEAHSLAGQRDLARGSFDAARRRLHELTSKEPDDSRYYGPLGVACAGLGLREEAVQAAQRGVELQPASTDAWNAPWRLQDLALVKTMLGQTDEAIDLLDQLLANSGEFSANAFRLDPRWEPLKKNSRFQRLLAKYDNKS